MLIAAASWMFAVDAAAQWPTASVSASSSVMEGDSGSTTLSFTIRLSRTSNRSIRLTFGITGGTATPETDYTPFAGYPNLPQQVSLRFSPGETVKVISVTVKGDRTDEPNETVVVSLSGGLFVYIGTGTATGTITDDDPAPQVTLALSRSSIAESGATNRTAVTARLDRPSSEDTTITVAAAAGANAASGDFMLSSSRTLTVAAGATSSTGTVTVTAVDNTLEEADKSVTVSGSATNSQGITQPASVTLTILEDDLTDLPIGATPESPPAPGESAAGITTSGDRTYLQGEQITPFGIAVSDPDGAVVGMEVVGLPPGLRHVDGWVEGTVAVNAPARVYPVTVTAYNYLTAALAEATFTITVTERDRKPTFGSASVPAQRYQVGLEIDPLTLPEATGGDGPLRYALTPAPPAPGLVYTAPDADASTGGVIAGTPTAVQTAVRCTLTATDADGDTATLTFTMTVAEDPTPVPAVPLVGQGLLAAFLFGLGAWFQRRRR